MVFAISGAHAAESTWFGEQKAAGSWMVGLKYGNMEHEGTGMQRAKNSGYVVGYTFARPVAGNGTAAIEVEFTNTNDDGTFTSESFQGTTGTWQVDSKAIYMAYRSAGTVYFKGKLGGVTTEIDYKTSATTLQEDKTQVSFGAGVGFRLTERANIELEYTGNIGINDISYVSAGVAVNF